MDAIDAFNILVHFFENVDILLLIFVRVLGFVLILPIIASQNIFMQGRLFLAFTISVALFMSGMVTTVYYFDTTVGYVYLILIEFLVGLAMGYTVFAVFNLIFFAGQLMDFQIGFMMVNVMDPMTQIQVPITGNVFFFCMTAMLVVTGGIHAFFLTFFYSYHVLPIGTAVVIGNASLALYMVGILSESVVLAVRLAMPIVGTILVVNGALGIMVKVSPQMNIFSVGLPIKIFIGLLLLWLVMAPQIGTMFGLIFDMAIEGMRQVIWGMTP